MCHSGDLIIGTCYANSGGNTRPTGSYVHYACVIGNRFIALGHYTHVALAIDKGLLNLCNRIVFNVIVAAGTAHGCHSFYCSGSAHGHAEDIAFGCGADIQIAHVHGSFILFIGIGQSCRGSILNPVYPYRHYACQEGVRSGKLQRRSPRLKDRYCIRLYRYQSFFAAIACINRSIVQACRIVFEDIGIRADPLGAEFGISRQTDTRRHCRRLGFIPCCSGDGCGFTVLLNRSNFRIVNLRTNRFFAVARCGTLIAFRQGNADAQGYSSRFYRQFAGTGNGGLACLVRRFHRHRRCVGNFIFCCPVSTVLPGGVFPMMPIFIFADHGNGIVVSPVHGKVTVGRHDSVFFIRCGRAYG